MEDKCELRKDIDTQTKGGGVKGGGGVEQGWWQGAWGESKLEVSWYVMAGVTLDSNLAEE